MTFYLRFASIIFVYIYTNYMKVGFSSNFDNYFDRTFSFDATSIKFNIVSRPYLYLLGFPLLNFSKDW